MAPRQKGVGFAALQHRDFRPYFVVSMLSMLADNMEHVISYWVMFEAFRSPLLGGFAVISHWTPSLLFSVYFGALSDRFDCRKIIQVSQALLITASLAWGLLFVTGALQVWHAVIILLMHGIAGALAAPAIQLLLHDIVGAQHLQSAVRLSATGRQLALVLGPAVGGLLMQVVGPAQGLLINALLYLPLTAYLLVIPYTGHRNEDGRPRPSPAINPGEMVTVLREVWGNSAIMSLVMVAGASSLLVGNAFQAQMPQLAYGLGVREAGLAYSALLAANAAGALVGGLVLEGMGLLQARVRTTIVCASLWCLAMAGFAASSNYLLALSLLFLAGAFNLTFTSMAQALVQLLAPAEIRGRVVGLFNTSQFGLRTGSGVTVGVLGSVIGVNWALGLSSALLLAITLALLIRVRGEK